MKNLVVMGGALVVLGGAISFWKLTHDSKEEAVQRGATSSLREGAASSVTTSVKTPTKPNQQTSPIPPRIAPPAPFVYAQEMRADMEQTWRSLRALPLPSPPPSATQQSTRGIVGQSFAAWRAIGAREGFEAVEGAERPTLRSGDTEVILRVREGIVLGAEVHFNQGLGAPEWSRVALMLAGAQALGGPQDPMLLLDQLSNPPPSKQLNSRQQITELLALRGQWSETEASSSLSYYIEVTPQGDPVGARVWMTPPTTP